MHVKPKKKIIENGHGGDELGLATAIVNGEDLGPIVRHAFQVGKPEILLYQLKNVAKKKELEIEELCKRHYEDFIRAVDELRGVLVDADELKNGLMKENFRLQEASTSLLMQLEELLDSHSTKTNVAMAIEMSKFCLEVVQLCSKCNNDILKDRLYPALKTLDLIEKDYLLKIPVKCLSRVIENQIPVIKSHIEKKVINDFNDWLVVIRSTAKEVGQQATRHTLNLDLQLTAAQSFLESHQTFFTQIAGFFIIEDRVLRTAGSLLSANQLGTMWDTTISKVSSILREQFSHIDSADNLLLIKDNVALLISTLKRYGYPVSSLLELLGTSRDKYHELLLKECRKQIDEVLARDTYEQMVMKKEYEYTMNVLAFNLQTSNIMPAFPYVAPFSAAVPDCCRVVRSFIEGSVSYSSYGGHVDFYDVVKKYLDKLLINVLNEALLRMISTCTSTVSQAMQIAANLIGLEHACDLFLKQAAQLCGLPVRVAERPHASLSARAVLKTSQDAAYDALLKLVNSKVDEFMCLADNINWTADEVQQNEYMNEVVIYLDTLLSTAQQILPMEALYKVGSGALKHISDTIVAAFLSDNVKRFNLNAVMSIDNDLKILESFADERFESSGLCEINIEGSLRDCLIEVRQLVNLLLSSQPENFMNPVIRERNYSSLDHKKVGIICEKFRDSPDRLFGSLSSRASKQDTRKKSMEVLRKRLKDLS
ncbi:Exocyst complex component [Nymphaea thermarum]|nr:Exocyst complex component [Nymphaea thermarum]